MNKKLLLIVGLVVTVGALAVVGVVSAQTITPSYGCGPNGYGVRGGMMGYGNGPRGMMGGGYGMTGANGTYGPMHDAMFNALAEGLGLSRADLDARAAAGETPYQIALSLGFTQTEFVQVMTDARSAALTDAVAQGYLTQDQADWMQNRMNRFGGQCPYLSAAPVQK
jgi:hypothetical protein